MAHAVEGGRAARVPCWDRAVVQGGLAVTLAFDPRSPPSRTRPSFGDPGERAQGRPLRRTIRCRRISSLRRRRARAADAVMVRRTPMRVWCVPGKSGFALGRNRRRLARVLEDYYGVPYPGDSRSPRHPGLRGRRDGEPRRHHLPRDGLLVDESAASHASSSGWPTWSRTRTRTCGRRPRHDDMWNGIWLNEALPPSWRCSPSKLEARVAALGDVRPCARGPRCRSTDCHSTTRSSFP